MYRLYLTQFHKFSKDLIDFVNEHNISEDSKPQFFDILRQLAEIDGCIPIIYHFFQQHPHDLQYFQESIWYQEFYNLIYQPSILFDQLTQMFFS